MPRARIDAGQWGKITLVPEVKVTRDNGAETWVECTAGRPQRVRATTRVRDADDGVLRQVTRYGPTQTKAEAALARELKARQERRAAKVLAESSDTVGRSAGAWLDEQRERLAGSSFDTYGQMLRRHIEPSDLAGMLLSDVRPSDVNVLLDTVTKGAGPGAAKTVRSVLRGTFERAVHFGHAEYNVVSQARTLRAPKARKPVKGERDTRRALTAAERVYLLSFADTFPYAQRHDLGDLVSFLAGTGVRLGEALALRWTHVDLDAGTALISATVSRVTGRGLSVQESTKTAQDRVVHLPGWLITRLAEPTRVESAAGVVFCTPLGNLRDRSNTSKQLRTLYDAAGLPWMSSHSLRRTAATLMDDAGLTIREVANALGHARPSMTLDVYLDRRQSAHRAADVL